eukprot:10624824-Karenia_brevis.AAC.1
MFREGDGTIGATHQEQLAKGIGRGLRAKYGRKHLRLGHGCSPEGYRDRWLPQTPAVTYPPNFGWQWP